MKKYLFLFVLIAFVSCKTKHSKIRASQHVVQDYANFFSDIEEQKLSKKIINYEVQTTNQICIYTIDSIPNKETALYRASTIANRLGVGTKDKNNGLLLLISRYDKKIAIATGTGTEKIITDSMVHSIINKTIAPKFKDSLYYNGITVALDSVFSKWK